MSKSEKTKQFIIEQAGAIINKKGIGSASIWDLMLATKLTKAEIYDNFESKEEIWLEVFRRLSGNVSKRLDDAMSTKTTAREKLFSVLDYYHDNVAFGDSGGCPLLNFSTVAGDSNPALKAEVTKAMKRSQQRIIKILEEGKATGEFKKSVDARFIAIKTFAMIEGVIFTSRVTNTKALMKRVIDSLKDEINML